MQLMFKYNEQKINNISIDAKYNFIPNQKKALFIAEKIRIDFIHNTAALEGNPYTYPEVKTLIEGITVGGHKVSDTEQILNLNHAFSYMIDIVKSVKNDKFYLTKEIFCAVQAIVARQEALAWGKFRESQVFIGGTEYIPPSSNNLNQIFMQGVLILNNISDPLLKAWLTFLWGSINQFFYEGNKRTSRLLASGILLTSGLPPLMILAKDQLQYNQTMTNFYNTQDATQAIVWLYEYYASYYKIYF